MPTSNELRYGVLAELLALISAPDQKTTLLGLAGILQWPQLPALSGLAAGISSAGISAKPSGLGALAYGMSLPRADGPTPNAGILRPGLEGAVTFQNLGVAELPRGSAEQGIGLSVGTTPLSRIVTGLLYTGSTASHRSALRGLHFPEDELAKRMARQAAPFTNGTLAVGKLPMVIEIFDVEHGSCAVIGSSDRQRTAMLDAGHNSGSGWRPSRFFKEGLKLNLVDYLFSQNFDQDHISDLIGVSDALRVGVLYRNPSASTEQLRTIKEENGHLTDDAERYLAMAGTFTAPVQVPFDAGMGGVTCSVFWNRYPRFRDTNNLSLVVFVKYGAFKILFPGDLEKDGWMALLQDPAFVAELRGTTILVAAHHGRWNGYCSEIFDYFKPMAVVISDKSIMHDTQDAMACLYRCHVHDNGVQVGAKRDRRHVLTTRKDGDLLLMVYPDGGFSVGTEFNP